MGICEKCKKLRIIISNDCCVDCIPKVKVVPAGEYKSKEKQLRKSMRASDLVTYLMAAGDTEIRFCVLTEYTDDGEPVYSTFDIGANPFIKNLDGSIVFSGIPRTEHDYYDGCDATHYGVKENKIL
jgi:hypothetical protein